MQASSVIKSSWSHLHLLYCSPVHFMPLINLEWVTLLSPTPPRERGINFTWTGTWTQEPSSLRKPTRRFADTGKSTWNRTWLSKNLELDWRFQQRRPVLQWPPRVLRPLTAPKVWLFGLRAQRALKGASLCSEDTRWPLLLLNGVGKEDRDKSVFISTGCTLY